MTKNFTTQLMTSDTSVVSTCLSGVRFRATGLSGAGFGNERPTKASAAAVAARVDAYAAIEAAADAGLRLVATAERPGGRTVISATGITSSTEQKQQHHTMWAFRGPEPWRDPA